MLANFFLMNKMLTILLLIIVFKSILKVEDLLILLFGVY